MTSTGWAGFGVASVALVLAMHWLGAPAVDDTATAAPAASRLRSDVVGRDAAAAPSSAIAANPFGGSPAEPPAARVTGPAAPAADARSSPFGMPASGQALPSAAPAVPEVTTAATFSGDPEPDN